MGPGADWRRIRESLPRDQWVAGLLELYKEQIRKLGYMYFDQEGIPSYGQRLYWLVFCSRVKLGADIWRRVALRKPDKQNTFDFE